MAVTKLDKDDIPKNPFRAPLERVDGELITKCKLSNTLALMNNITYKALPALNDITLNETCFQGGSYDYFSNSEISYILTFTFVSAFVFGKYHLCVNSFKNTKIHDLIKEPLE